MAHVRSIYDIFRAGGAMAGDTVPNRCVFTYHVVFWDVGSFLVQLWFDNYSTDFDHLCSI